MHHFSKDKKIFENKNTNFWGSWKVRKRKRKKKTIRPSKINGNERGKKIKIYLGTWTSVKENKNVYLSCLNF